MRERTIEEIRADDDATIHELYGEPQIKMGFTATAPADHVQCLFDRHALIKSFEWRLIETAPKDGTHILAYSPQQHYGITLVWWNADDSGLPPIGWYDGTEWGIHQDAQCTFTHWLPLPEPPK